MEYETLTTEQYYVALNALSSEMSDSDIEMLRVNYRAPNHTITATEMAREMNWPSYSAACLRYGTLARRFMRYFGIATPKDVNVEMFVDFVMPDEPGNTTDQIEWVLRPALANALKKMNWV